MEEFREYLVSEQLEEVSIVKIVKSKKVCKKSELSKLGDIVCIYMNGVMYDHLSDSI